MFCSLSSIIDPVGPTHLQVEQVQDLVQYKTTSDPSLRVTWTRSAGNVDWYHVTLKDSSSGSTHSTSVMGSAAPQTGFTNLNPGHLYTVSVVAAAGDKKASPVQTSAATGKTDTFLHKNATPVQLLTCVFDPPPAAPSPVRGLQVSSSSAHSLDLSWRAGPGRVERFRVLLTDQGGTLLKNFTSSNTEASAHLDHLQPGTLYDITVVSEAEGLQSSASIQAVTGVCPASCSEGVGVWIRCCSPLSFSLILFSPCTCLRPDPGPQRQLRQSAGLLGST